MLAGIVHNTALRTLRQVPCGWCRTKQRALYVDKSDVDETGYDWDGSRLLCHFIWRVCSDTFIRTSVRGPVFHY